MTENTGITGKYIVGQKLSDAEFCGQIRIKIAELNADFDECGRRGIEVNWKGWRDDAAIDGKRYSHLVVTVNFSKLVEL